MFEWKKCKSFKEETFTLLLKVGVLNLKHNWIWILYKILSQGITYKNNKNLINSNLFVKTVFSSNWPLLFHPRPTALTVLSISRAICTPRLPYSIALRKIHNINKQLKFTINRTTFSPLNIWTTTVESKARVMEMGTETMTQLWIGCAHNLSHYTYNG